MVRVSNQKHFVQLTVLAAEVASEMEANKWSAFVECGRAWKLENKQERLSKPLTRIALPIVRYWWRYAPTPIPTHDRAAANKTTWHFSEIFPFLGNRPMFGNHLVGNLQLEDYDMPMPNDAPSHPQQIFTKNFGGLIIMSCELFSTFSRRMNATHALMEALFRASAGLALGNPAAAPARLLRFRKHRGQRNLGANVLHHLRQRCGSKTNKFHGCYLAALTVVHILRRQETSAAD